MQYHFKIVMWPHTHHILVVFFLNSLFFYSNSNFILYSTHNLIPIVTLPVPYLFSSSHHFSAAQVRYCFSSSHHFWSAQVTHHASYTLLPLLLSSFPISNPRWLLFFLVPSTSILLLLIGALFGFGEAPSTNSFSLCKVSVVLVIFLGCWCSCL